MSEHVFQEISSLLTDLSHGALHAMHHAHGQRILLIVDPHQMNVVSPFLGLMREECIVES